MCSRSWSRYVGVLGALLLVTLPGPGRAEPGPAAGPVAAAAAPVTPAAPLQPVPAPLPASSAPPAPVAAAPGEPEAAMGPPAPSPTLAESLADPGWMVPAAELPRLDWEQVIHCVRDTTGKNHRVQCSQAEPNAEQICLVAPADRRDGGPLLRIKECNHLYSQDRLPVPPAGRRLVPAIAEAPPGWYRDEQGRVFQITFDLFKRFFLGAAWSPAFELPDGTATLERAYLDMGFVASWLVRSDRNRYTIRALEGRVALPDLSAQGLLFAWDSSHASNTPVLRITTFFGEPQRHDVYMDLGFGASFLGVDARPHRVEAITDVQFLETHLGWDILQSNDLYNHLRFQVGVGLGAVYSDVGEGRDDMYLAPQLGLELRAALDEAGFNLLRLNVHGGLPIWLAGPEGGTRSNRLGASLSFERILLAVNDQPLTVLLACGADYRDDLARGANQQPSGQPVDFPEWDATATLGLRLSFWAPTRIKQQLDTAVRY